MSYIHLTITERASIEILRKENYSLRAIAKRLNRSVSTISREIKRNKSNHNYVAETAQTNYETRKKNCGRPSKLTNELINTIIHHLKLRWSPEQIVGRLLQNNICFFKTIYRWINANSFTLDLFPYLRHKGKGNNLKKLEVVSMLANQYLNVPRVLKTQFFWPLGSRYSCFKQRKK